MKSQGGLLVAAVRSLWVQPGTGPGPRHGGREMSKKGKRQPKPSEQRSNVKNPNNPEVEKARDHRANQLNPNHAPAKRGRQSS